MSSHDLSEAAAAVSLLLSFHLSRPFRKNWYISSDLSNKQNIGPIAALSVLLGSTSLPDIERFSKKDFFDIKEGLNRNSSAETIVLTGKRVHNILARTNAQDRKQGYLSLSLSLSIRKCLSFSVPYALRKEGIFV